MVTSKQLCSKNRKNIRKYKFHRKKTPVLKGCPQKKGVCVRVYIENPKKPNSAKRKICKVFLYSTKKNIRAQIPGEGHSLSKFSRVLIRGGRTRDLPGIRCRVVRGKFDCNPLINRRKSISKFGVKRSWIIKEKEKNILSEINKDSFKYTKKNSILINKIRKKFRIKLNLLFTNHHNLRWNRDKILKIKNLKK